MQGQAIPRIDEGRTVALHACQGRCETIRGDHVHAARPRHRDEIVSPGLEHINYVTAI
jgi:hypothetical protein